jgi:hypothetical protein
MTDDAALEARDTPVPLNQRQRVPSRANRGQRSQAQGKALRAFPVTSQAHRGPSSSALLAAVNDSSRGSRQVRGRHRDAIPATPRPPTSALHPAGSNLLSTMPNTRGNRTKRGGSNRSTVPRASSRGWRAAAGISRLSARCLGGPRRHLTWGARAKRPSRLPLRPSVAAASVPMPKAPSTVRSTP